MLKKPFLLLLIFLFQSCTMNKLLNQESTSGQTVDPITSWYQKDLTADSIPGISLDKWYGECKIKKAKNEIIVAVLDSQIDLDHEDLTGQFWINKNEIANNGIDDDNNGYIDDINGWNFVGKKNGESLEWSNHEFIRVIRKFQNEFKSKEEIDIPAEKLDNYLEYQNAISTLKSKLKYYEDWQNSIIFLKDIYFTSKDSIKKYFPTEKYTIKQLDSLYKLKKINEKSFLQRKEDKDYDVGALIDYMIISKEMNLEYDNLVLQETLFDSIINKSLNLSFNDRFEIGDNEGILEKGYGNNNVNTSSSNSSKNHSTSVSSLIIANRKNKIGIQGFSSNIKIMPICISPKGEKHDKDIAMAIYYAVDNGAKIINMSFSKEEFSVNKEWVFDAINYAEARNVLIVSSAGNNAHDIDKIKKFPNDLDYVTKREISDNFINVGASTNNFNAKLISNSSNFGKLSVDLFAPGSRISVAIKENKYEYADGTSYAAPMVSGTAALIWLYYPQLTVQEVKNIILESGVTIDQKVIKPGTQDEMVPFSELCKSGKILNTYNAMKMAEEVSKKKKQKMK